MPFMIGTKGSCEVVLKVKAIVEEMVDRAFGTGEYSENVGELLGVFDDLVVMGGSTAEGGTSSDPGVGGDAWTPPPGSSGDAEVGDSGVCNKPASSA